MSHSISETRKKRPMWSYESNYNYLLKLVEPCLKGEQNKISLHYTSGHFVFEVREWCRYTVMLTITQVLDSPSEHVTGFEFNIRLYLDARVAEVVSYKDNNRLLPLYEYPNSNMYQMDEKKQANIILNECLSFLYHHGLNSKCYSSVV